MSTINVKIENKKNKYIIDEFIRYYEFIYSNQDILQKTPQEIYYKLQNIKKTINILSKYKKEITIDELPNIKKIKYIGDKTIGRIEEIINTKKLSEITKETKKIKTIQDLTQIYGIGAKKAIDFYNKKIYTIEDLIKNQDLLTNAQKISLKYYKNLCIKIPKVVVLFFEVWFLKKLYDIDKNYVLTICGSYRREKDFTSDIDILITHEKIKNMTDTEKYLNEIVNILYENKFLIDTLTQGSNNFQGYGSFEFFKNVPKKFNKIVRVDIKVVPHKSLWTSILHMTGSFQFNEKLRGIAKTKNMKLNEYHLVKNNKPLKINSEEDIFKYLNIEYVSPIDRD